jgi:protein arginine kinase
VEHVTLVRTWPGLLPAEGFAAAHRPPDEEAHLPFARSPRFGLLASDPSRAGSGTSFRILAHLPALGLARKLAQAGAALSALGIGCLPVTRRGESPFGPRALLSEGDLFWLLSRGSLGLGAEAAYRRFIADVQPLLRWESEMQRRCLEKHRKRLEERVQGFLQPLADGKPLDEPDWDKAASQARLGAYVGILDAQIPDLLEDLRAKTGPGHLEVSSCRTLSKEEADMARANIVRLSLERHRTRA